MTGGGHVSDVRPIERESASGPLLFDQAGESDYVEMVSIPKFIARLLQRILKRVAHYCADQVEVAEALDYLDRALR